MGKIIMMGAVSVDGFWEGPQREIDWHRVDEELHGHFNREIRKAAAFLNGRITHEMMAGFWPTADKDPASSPTMVEFAGIWRDMPKIVYSKTLQKADWNATLVREVDPKEVSELKARTDGDMLVGGPNLAASFMRHGLVDEFRIYVHPITIGKGRTMFQDYGSRIPLRLTETRAFGNGVVLNTYATDKG